MTRNQARTVDHWHVKVDGVLSATPYRTAAAARGALSEYREAGVEAHGVVKIRTGQRCPCREFQKKGGTPDAGAAGKGPAASAETSDTAHLNFLSGGSYEG